MVYCPKERLYDRKAQTMKLLVLLGLLLSLMPVRIQAEFWLCFIKISS